VPEPDPDWVAENTLSDGTDPVPCALCGKDYHAEKATEADEYGLYCPGAETDEESRLNYLYRRAYKRDEKKMEDKQHWATLNADLALAEHERKEAIERGEGRSKVTQEELQADCDTRVADLRGDRTWKGNYWLGQVTQDQATAQLRDEQLAEGLHVDPPHLTVTGRPPLGASPVDISGAIVSTAELKASEHVGDAALYLNTALPNPPADDL